MAIMDRERGVGNRIGEVGDFAMRRTACRVDA